MKFILFTAADYSKRERAEKYEKLGFVIKALKPGPFNSFYYVTGHPIIEIATIKDLIALLEDYHPWRGIIIAKVDEDDKRYLITTGIAGKDIPNYKLIFYDDYVEREF